MRRPRLINPPLPGSVANNLLRRRATATKPQHSSLAMQGSQMATGCASLDVEDDGVFPALRMVLNAIG